MSAQRNSLHGKTKAPELIESPALPIPATGDTEIKTTPRVIVSIVVACVSLAVMWATLSINVSAHGTRLEKQEAVSGEVKRDVSMAGRQIEKLDDRTTSLEDWRKEMQAQREDIKAIRAMLEDQARKEKKP